MTSRPGRSPMKCLRAVTVCVAVCACSPVMEATRPDPVDLSQFVAGQQRIDIMAEIGSPATTTIDGGDSCDIYKLYTRGPEAAGKGVLAAGEVVADVLTLGLSEIIFTPVEAATRNSKHTVVFCYDPNNRLAAIKESDTHVD